MSTDDLYRELAAEDPAYRTLEDYIKAKRKEHYEGEEWHYYSTDSAVWTAQKQEEADADKS